MGGRRETRRRGLRWSRSDEKCRVGMRGADSGFTQAEVMEEVRSRWVLGLFLNWSQQGFHQI